MFPKQNQILFLWSLFGFSFGVSTSSLYGDFIAYHALLIRTTSSILMLISIVVITVIKKTEEGGMNDREQRKRDRQN